MMWKIQVLILLITFSMMLGIIVGYIFRSIEEVEIRCKDILKSLYPFAKKEAGNEREV